MRVYIAGRFTGQARIRGEAEALKMADPSVEITSEWLWSNEPDYPVTNEQALTYALRDWEQLHNSDMIILDTIDDSTTGGREVEFGLAIDWNLQKIIIGPYRNVFHWLADEHYDSWAEFFAVKYDMAAEVGT